VAIILVVCDSCQESGEDYITRSAIHLTKYYSGDQIKKTELGRSCSAYGGELRCLHDFGGET
jgi:hypothetical protein